MRLVFVVDEGAVALCSALNSVASRDGVNLRFEALLTPGQMFREAAKAKPDLVLIHHNWSGISISKILEQLVAICDDIRVVVFTGQRIKIAELIECVRGGVVDYWERDQMSTDFIFQQTSYYCSNAACTVKTLKGASGSVVQLAQRAEDESELRRDVEQQRDALARRVEALESKERRAAARYFGSFLKAVAVTGLLLAAFLLANNFTKAGPYWSLAFVVICGVILLFLDGRISSAHFKGTGWSAFVKKDGDSRRRL